MKRQYGRERHKNLLEDEFLLFFFQSWAGKCAKLLHLLLLGPECAST